ncbi:uncharacterized protein [Apostichopus japonicus]|uniref:uncharacterized protein n=1 Tax=Stichopus japonicus TaxID=307972 RepID=UPI003AB443DA
MIRFSSILGGILLLLLVVGPRGSATITVPDVCLRVTLDKVWIRLELKPSLNATSNLHKTLDLTNVRCCDNPHKTCSPPRPMTLSFDNVLSLVQYPIRPTSMAVSKKTDSDVDFRDDLWYSLYEFEEPFLNQSFDLCLTFDLPDASTQGVYTRLDLYHKFRGIKQAKTYTSVIMRQRQPLGEDYIRTNQFLLIRELAVDDNKNRQTTADQSEYVVLSQSPTNNIPDDPNYFVEQSQCYIDVGQLQCLKQRCMDSTRCYRYIMSDDLFNENKFGQARNQSTPCTLSSSHHTLHDPKSISRDRKAVAFNTQESIFLSISIEHGSENRTLLAELPNEIREQTKILAVLIRNLLGASVNYMLDNLMHVIRYCIATYGREVDLQVQRLLANLELHKAKWSAIVDGYYTLKDRLYYVIYAFDLYVSTIKYIAHTLAPLEELWFSFVDMVTIHVDELSVFVHSCSTFYRIPIEKLIHHRWNLIWSTATSTELAIDNHQLKGALTNIHQTIVLSALANAVTGFITIVSLLLFVKLTTTRSSSQPSRRVSCNDFIIYTAENTGSVNNDTVTTDNIDTEETETFVTPMLTPRNSSLSTVVEFRSRMKVFLDESVSESCLSHLMGSTDKTGYDSDYMLDRCLSERDVTRRKYGKKVQRSIITPSYIASLLRDDDVIIASASEMNRNVTRSTYLSDDYDGSLSSTDFSSHMLSSSSDSSVSLTSSSTASSISLPPSAVAITEATLATGDAANIQLDEPTPAVSECIAEIGNDIAETVNIDIPLNHRDLHTEITEQLTGTGNLPNGLFYPNLEETFLFLSLTFFKNQFFN